MAVEMAARAHPEPQWRLELLLEPTSQTQARSKWLLETAWAPQRRQKLRLELLPEECHLLLVCYRRQFLLGSSLVRAGPHSYS